MIAKGVSNKNANRKANPSFSHKPGVKYAFFILNKEEKLSLASKIIKKIKEVS